MRRTLAILTTTISSLLLLATIVLWIRGYWLTDQVWRLFPEQSGVHAWSLGAGSSRGGICFLRVDYAPATYWTTQPSGWNHIARGNDQSDYAGLPSHWFEPPPRLGFATVSQSPGSARVRGVAIPLWTLALAFAGLPAVRLRAWLKHRKFRNPGCCRVCGYDLRATPDPDGELLPTCPECGDTSAVPSAAIREPIGHG